MPDINMQVFEEAQRNQLVTEVDIQTQAALDDYQVQLSDVDNPTQSQDNIVIDRYGEFLPHWNESLDFDTWVKASMEVAGKRLLMLRGNSNVSNASNGDDTFIQWHGVASATFLDALNVNPTNIVFEAKARTKSDTHNFRVGLSNTTTTETDDCLKIISYNTTNLRYMNSRKNNVATNVSETPKFTTNTYYKLKIINTGSNVSGFVDGNQIDANITTNIPTDNMGLSMWLSIGTGDQLWSFVRKYITTEPTYSIGTSKNILTALKLLGRAG